MIHRLAEDITFYFIKNHYISIEDREVYEYGAEVLLSNGVVILLLCIFSIITNSFSYAICFILIFAPLRACIGGFHASNQRNCIILTLFIYILLFYLKDSIIQYVNIQIITTLLVADAVFLLSVPQVNKNHFLVEEEIRRNMVKSKILILIDHIAIGILIYGGNTQFPKFISLVLGTVALLILAEKIKKGGKKGEESNK